MPDRSHEEFGSKLIQLLPRLRRFARVLTDSSHDGDDLVQTALESAIRKRAQLKNDKALDSWMFSILRSTWINEVRSRSVRRGNGVTDAQYLPDNNPGNNQEQVTSSEQLRRAVAALSENQKSVIALVDIEGMTYEEASLVLNIPKGTLMSRLSRAREALLLSMSDAQNEQPVRRNKVRTTVENAANVH